jgi:microsomal epoxide hydrolase
LGGKPEDGGARNPSERDDREKFRAWSDCGGDHDAAFSKDDLLTNVMLYVATGRAGSPLWFYRGFFLEAGGGTHASPPHT